MFSKALLFMVLCSAIHWQMVDSTIQVNLRSASLHRFLTGETPEQSTSPPPAPQDGLDDAMVGGISVPGLSESSIRQDEGRNQKILELDLSGRVESHLLGPLDIDPFLPTRTRKPLLWIPGSPWAVIIGADYNFSERWYGVRQFLATLRWKQPPGSSSLQLDSVELLRQQPLKRGERTSRFPQWPGQIDWTGEIHVESGDTAGQLLVQWEADSSAGTSIQARVNNHGDAHCSCQIPVIPDRLRFIWTVLPQRLLSIALPGSKNGEPSLATRTSSDQPWWIPDISVNAMGLIQSVNNFSIPRTSMGGQHYRGPWNARFTIRRRLGWILGGGWGDDGMQECETWVGLDVTGIDAAQRYATTVRLQAQCEHPQSTASVIVSHATCWQTLLGGPRELDQTGE